MANGFPGKREDWYLAGINAYFFIKTDLANTSGKRAFFLLRP
jgi:hypothetical protein